MSGRLTGGPMTDERRNRAAIDDLDRRLGRVETGDVRIEAGRRLFVRSPNGHYWNITVDNAGTITATDVGTTL
jgi:hypothetical protein